MPLQVIDSVERLVVPVRKAGQNSRDERDRQESNSTLLIVTIVVRSDDIAHVNESGEER